MSALDRITNIHVDSVDHFGKRAAAGWELDGARFHIWFKLGTRELERDFASKRAVLYKNPPLGVERHVPGFFNTVHLNAEAAVNSKIVAHVFEVIERDGLIAVALAARDAEDLKRRQEEEERARLNRFRDAAPALVAALEKIRDVCHTGTARADFEVRHEAFVLAQRELVALGHTPYDWDGSDARELERASESHSAMGEYLQRRGG